MAFSALYLWGCFPSYIRSFILVGVVWVILAAFFGTFRRD